MDYDLGKRIAKRFGITLVCLIAARGCVREVQAWVEHGKNHGGLEQTVHGEYRMPTPKDIAQVLQEERYAP